MKMENNKTNNYVTPLATIIVFDNEDIIRTSGVGDPGFGANGDKWHVTPGDDFWG